jgi:hypothetical protein
MKNLIFELTSLIINWNEGLPTLEGNLRDFINTLCPFEHTFCVNALRFCDVGKVVESILLARQILVIWQLVFFLEKAERASAIQELAALNLKWV